MPANARPGSSAQWISTAAGSWSGPADFLLLQFFRKASSPQGGGGDGGRDECSGVYILKPCIKIIEPAGETRVLVWWWSMAPFFVVCHLLRAYPNCSGVSGFFLCIYRLAFLPVSFSYVVQLVLLKPGVCYYCVTSRSWSGCIGPHKTQCMTSVWTRTFLAGLLGRRIKLMWLLHSSVTVPSPEGLSHTMLHIVRESIRQIIVVEVGQCYYLGVWVCSFDCGYVAS